METSSSISHEQILELSSGKPSVTLRATVLVELVPKEAPGPDAKIGLPANMPEDLIDELWGKHMCNGVNAPIAAANYPNEDWYFRVDFAEWELLEHYDALAGEEFDRLGEYFGDIAFTLTSEGMRDISLE